MSFLSSALGFDKNDAGDPFRKQQTGLISSALGLTPHYDDIANSQEGLYNDFTPQYQQAVQGYGDYLVRGTTDQQRAQYIANATRNVAGNMQAGLSNATTNLAARGLGDSGNMAGVVGNAYTGQAGAVSSAANDADAYFTNLRQQNMAKLAALYGGASDSAMHNTEGALGAETSLDQWGAGQEGQLAQQAYALQAQHQQALQQGLGDLVGVASTIYGAGAGKSAKPSGTGYAPYPTDGTYDTWGDGGVQSFAPSTTHPDPSSWVGGVPMMAPQSPVNLWGY